MKFVHETHDGPPMRTLKNTFNMFKKTSKKTNVDAV